MDAARAVSCTPLQNALRHTGLERGDLSRTACARAYCLVAARLRRHEDTRCASRCSSRCSLHQPLGPRAAWSHKPRTLQQSRRCPLRSATCRTRSHSILPVRDSACCTSTCRSPSPPAMHRCCCRCRHGLPARTSSIISRATYFASPPRATGRRWCGTSSTTIRGACGRPAAHRSPSRLIIWPTR